MKVADILRVKGGTLFTVPPEQLLAQALQTMAERDIGSLVVMDHGELTGMLTFREVILAIVKNGGTVGTITLENENGNVVYSVEISTSNGTIDVKVDSAVAQTPL